MGMSVYAMHIKNKRNERRPAEVVGRLFYLHREAGACGFTYGESTVCTKIRGRVLKISEIREKTEQNIFEIREKLKENIFKIREKRKKNIFDFREKKRKKVVKSKK